MHPDTLVDVNSLIKDEPQTVDVNSLISDGQKKNPSQNGSGQSTSSSNGRSGLLSGKRPAGYELPKNGFAANINLGGTTNTAQPEPETPQENPSRFLNTDMMASGKGIDPNFDTGLQLAAYHNERNKQLDNEKNILRTQILNHYQDKNVQQGDIATGIRKLPVKPLVPETEPSVVQNLHTGINDINDYQNKLNNSIKHVASVYVGTKTKDPVEAGRMVRTILGDKNAAKEQVYQEKELPIAPAQQFYNEREGIDALQTSLDERYQDKSDPEYLKEKADLDLKSKSLINKYPEFRDAQIAKALVQQILKDHPNASSAMMLPYGAEAAKKLGLTKEEWKNIDFDNLPFQNVAGTALGVVYNSVLNMGAGAARIGSIFGIDKDKTDAYLNQALQRGQQRFEDVEGLQNAPTIVDTDKASKTYLQDIANPDKGKYNYNFHTISNSIAGGIANLASIVGETKLLGGVAKGFAPSIAPATEADLGMAATMIGQGYEPYYQQARTVVSDKPQDEWKRHLYAFLNGSLDYLAFKPLTKLQEIVSPSQAKELGTILNGASSLEEVSKTKLKNWTTKVLEGVGNTLKETGVVGGSTTIADVGKNVIDNILGTPDAAKQSDRELGGKVTDNLSSLFFTMAIPLGLGELTKGIQHSFSFKENLYNAGLNPKTYAGKANELLQNGTINQDQFNKRMQVINTVSDVVNSIPEDLNLNHNQKVAYVNSKMKELALQAKADKIKDPALEQYYKQKIQDEVNNRINTINGADKDLPYENNSSQLNSENNATQEGNITENNLAEHQNGGESGSTAKASGSNSPEQSREEQEKVSSVGLSHGDWLDRNRDLFPEEKYNQLNHDLNSDNEVKRQYAIDEIVAKKKEVNSQNIYQRAKDKLKSQQSESEKAVSDLPLSDQLKLVRTQLSKGDAGVVSDALSGNDKNAHDRAISLLAALKDGKGETETSLEDRLKAAKEDLPQIDNESNVSKVSKANNRAKELLAQLITKNLERIANENGIEVTGKMSADDVISALKEKQITTTSTEVNKPIAQKLNSVEKTSSKQKWAMRSTDEYNNEPEFEWEEDNGTYKAKVRHLKDGSREIEIFNPNLDNKFGGQIIKVSKEFTGTDKEAIDKYFAPEGEIKEVPNKTQEKQSTPTEINKPISVNEGEQKSILGSNVDLKGNKKKVWMQKAETADEAKERLVKSVDVNIANNPDLGFATKTYIDKEGKSTEVELHKNDDKYEWFYEKSKKPFASFDNTKDAVDYIMKQPFWDNGELNKNGRDDAYFAKSKAEHLQREIDNGNVRQDVSEGKISVTDAKNIIENAGLEVPKDILEKVNSENKAPKEKPISVNNEIKNENTTGTDKNINAAANIKNGSENKPITEGNKKSKPVSSPVISEPKKSLNTSKDYIDNIKSIEKEIKDKYGFQITADQSKNREIFSKIPKEYSERYNKAISDFGEFNMRGVTENEEPQTKSNKSNSGLRNVLDKHEENENETPMDLVQSIENYVKDNPNGKLEKAINNYWDAYKESRDVYGDRMGLTDDAFDSFQKVLDQEIKKEENKPEPFRKLTDKEIKDLPPHQKGKIIAGEDNRLSDLNLKAGDKVINSYDGKTYTVTPLETKNKNTSLPEFELTDSKGKVTKESERPIYQKIEEQPSNNKPTNKDNENITPKEQTPEGNIGESGDNKGKEDNEKPVTILKQRAKPQIKSPLYRKALDVQDDSPNTQVLKYFISGGKISDSALKEFFGDKRGEINAKIQLRGKDAPKTIDALAHYFWDSKENRDRYTTEDFREAIESVLQNHNSRTSMAKELANAADLADPEKQMQEFYDKHYGEAEKEGVDEDAFNEAIDRVEQMPDKDIQKEVDLNEAVQSARNKYDKAQNDLKKAEDEYAKEQAKQGDIFDADKNFVQKNLFANNRDAIKNNLDPLRQAVREAKYNLTEAQKNLDLFDAQFNDKNLFDILQTKVGADDPLKEEKEIIKNIIQEGVDNNKDVLLKDILKDAKEAGADVDKVEQAYHELGKETTIEPNNELSKGISKRINTFISKLFGKNDNYIYVKSPEELQEIANGGKGVKFSMEINGKKTDVKTLPDVVNGFYSPLEKTINETKFDKLPAKQWAEKFANGDEAKWTGLTDWLKSQSGSVSKSDIQKYLKDNRIEIVEVQKGENVPLEGVFKERQDLVDEAAGKGYTFEWWSTKHNFPDVKDKDGYQLFGDEIPKEIMVLAKKAEKLTPEINTSDKGSTSPKFEEYQVAGDKTNYKEVLVTMPSKIKGGEETPGQISKRMFGKDSIYDLTPDQQDKVMEVYNKGIDIGEQKLKTDFRSSHFDEPNILVHLRTNIRTDAQGKKVLFLEEVQSDWGQKGKREGFRDKNTDVQKHEKNIADLKDKLASLDDRAERNYKKRQELGLLPNSSSSEIARFDSGHNEEISRLEKALDKVRNNRDWDEINNRIDEIKKQIRETVAEKKDIADQKSKHERELNLQEDLLKTAKKFDNSTPPAPFVTDTNQWVKLGLKVALKEAVKEGADKIAWTNGEQQNDRYDLSKQIQSLEYGKRDDGTYDLRYIENGARNTDWKSLGKQIPENKLEDYVGKDIAQKIINKEGGGRFLHGVDLKVGGSGMKGFYGQPEENNLGIVGRVAKSLFKQEPKTTTINDIATKNAIVKKYGIDKISQDKYSKEFSKLSHDERLEVLLEAKIKGIDTAKFNSEYSQSGRLEGIGKSTQHSIDITPELKASVEKGQPLFMRNEEGKILGLTKDGQIYLNKDALNPGSIIHEAGHIWTEWAKENNKPVYQRGIDLVNGSRYFKQVSANEFYQKEALKLGKKGSPEYNEYLQHEALAKAIGDKGAQFVTETKRNSFASWAKNLFDSIAKKLGLKGVTADELQNMTLDELSSRVARDILAGEPTKAEPIKPEPKEPENKEEPPPPTEEENVKAGDNLNEWSRINLKSLLPKVRDMFRKVNIAWDDRAKSAMENLAKEAQLGETLVHAATTRLDNFYKELNDNKKIRFNSEDQTVMHFLHIATQQEMAKAAESAQKDNTFTSINSIASQVLDEQFNRVNAVLGAMRSEGGVILGAGITEARLHPDYGFEVRQMQMIKANKGEPLNEETEQFLKDQWEKEKELNKQEQEVREQGLKADFDKRIAELQRQHEAKLKELGAKPKTVKEKTSSKLRDFAKGLRTSDEFDKFIKNAGNNDVTRAGFSIDINLKEAVANAAEHIADLLDKGEKIADAIKDAARKFKGDLDEADFSKILNNFYTKASLPDKEVALQNIKDLAAKGGDTEITTDMVEGNHIRDYVNSFIGDVDQKDLLNEASKGLKEILPDVTKKQLIEAYLKEGDYKPQTKEELKNGVAEAKKQLVSIAKLEEDIEDLNNLRGVRQRLFPTEREKSDYEQKLYDEKQAKLKEISDRAAKIREDNNRIEKERDRQLKVIQDLNEKKAELEKGIRRKTEKNPSKEDTPEIEDLKKQVQKVSDDLRKAETEKRKIEREAQNKKDKLGELNANIERAKNDRDLIKTYRGKTDREVDAEIAEKQKELKKFTKSNTSDERIQKQLLEKAKKDAMRKRDDLQQKLDKLKETGELEGAIKESPKTLKKEDAELINIRRQLAQVQSAYREKQNKLREKEMSVPYKLADVGRSLWVDYLIGSPKTLAKIAWMGFIKPATDVGRRMAFGKLFHLFSPEISSAAKRGGESSSWRTIQSMAKVYFRQLGEKGLQKMYEKAEKNYYDAYAKYIDYANSDKPEKKVLADLKKDMDNKMFITLGNFMHQFVGGSSIKDAYDSFIHRVNYIEKQFGDIHEESLAKATEYNPELSNRRNLLNAELGEFSYIANFVGRSHAALKSFSARASFAAGFMARIEADIEAGKKVDGTRLLEIGNESYIDWERGKYQQGNMMSNSWNNVLRSEWTNNPKWHEYEKYLKQFLRGDIAVTRVPVNILYEEAMEFGAGAFRAVHFAQREYNKAFKQAIEEGYAKKADDDLTKDFLSKEFQDRVKEIVRDMDGDMAAKIARNFQKGGIGIGLYTLAILWGGVHFGIFPHKGQTKKKDEDELKPDELNPGQVMFGNTKMGETTSAAIEHTPALWPLFMGLGMAQQYHNDIKKGKMTVAAAKDATWVHLQIIEGQIPFGSAFSPLEFIKESVGRQVRKTTDSMGLTDPVDTKGGLPKTSIGRKYLEDNNINLPELDNTKVKINIDSKHPEGKMTQDEFSIFKDLRSKILDSELSNLAASDVGQKLTKEQKKEAAIKAESQATTQAKKEMIKAGYFSEKEPKTREEKRINEEIKRLFKKGSGGGGGANSKFSIRNLK